MKSPRDSTKRRGVEGASISTDGRPKAADVIRNMDEVSAKTIFRA